MATKIIYTGEILSSHTASATIIGIQIFFKFTPADLLNPSSGAAISATTAGLIPLNIDSITGFSLNWVNKTAIISITINEGKIIPALQNRLPLKPNCLLPTNMAVFNDMGPGADCARASISINSSSSSDNFLLTTSLRIKGIMA